MEVKVNYDTNNEWFENLPKEKPLTDAERVEKCPLTEFQRAREQVYDNPILSINQIESEQD